MRDGSIDVDTGVKRLDAAIEANLKELGYGG